MQDLLSRQFDAVTRLGRCLFAAGCRVLIWTSLAIGFALTTAAARADDEFPDELVRFTPAAQNPVFTAGPAGQWDAKIRERGWILREGDTWKLWYTGYDGTTDGMRRVGLATSTDGISWTRDAASPLVADRWIEDMQVLKVGETYVMFAEGAGDQAQWLSSLDGKQWKHEGKLDVRNRDGTPISAGAYGTPAVWFEAGAWNLFYERSDLGVWLARSSDLKVWTNVQDEPVLARGPEPYDTVMIAVNQVIHHKGRYYASYHGTGSPEKPRLWTSNVAVSTDLIHWKKYPGNPLFPAQENKSSGLWVFDGKQYRLYTMHDKVDLHYPSR